MEKIDIKIQLKISIIKSFVNFTTLFIILLFMLLFLSIGTFQVFQFAIPITIDTISPYLLLLSLVIGAILISISFYYWRLNKPIKQLSEAIEKAGNCPSWTLNSNIPIRVNLVRFAMDLKK